MKLHSSLVFVSVTVLAVAICSTLAAAADSGQHASHEREMLRRTQEALRDARSSNDELARAKADAEQKLRDAQLQLENARAASKSNQAALQTTAKVIQPSLVDFLR